jgi:ankyrin repeat protein
MEAIFQKLCDNGNGNMETIFQKLCENGYLKDAKQIYLQHPIIHNSANIHKAFASACFYGHLEVAQWLLEVKPTIDISAKNEEAFRGACLNGQLKMVKWLLDISSTIDISAKNEDAFRHACMFGHLEVAQWLLIKKPTIDIKNVCLKYCNNEMKEWLKSLENTNSFQETIQEPKDCSICLTEKVANCQTNCNHFYCKSCIDGWLKKENTCPYCREKITKIYNLVVK